MPSLALHSQLPVTASKEQELADITLVCKLNPEKRQSLERRLCNGKSREEELPLIENLEAEVRDRLENRIRGGYSKAQAFMAAMFYWYRNLEPKRKDRLTGVQLKRQALAVCREYFIEYYTGLPLDWVQTMKNDLGMELDKYKNKVGYGKMKPAKRES